ncbi:hypothetical protein L550_1216 [Bordetella pertussis H973]|uniref:Uncharacterized protein n=1 Tax=Bordetella pertussis CHLA-26 TaxID=1331284 RepID=A0AAI9IZ67_BORPT|nr:hypothetical protein V483_0932 [Bordetella pertussis CHLA-11]ETG98910.1 hypothetical protein L569_0922 [Bordetella pertussis 2250905]ETH05676.1 hypothetical protein L570_0878 [Bordetella pertussis 2356847]ETH07592.1 hypothetical protein L571_0887 [Bordetella pertussis 2371640]ETH11664.1 hypothetical protein L574_0809 [Bordetella pertussis STO1-SEAT-0006]ETH15972.1 hypothetical protein L575_3666 [Bordetella pertussis STO1-SEAT-0007]ETH20195.1 hypothetical protein L563_0777 [Bordetella pertu
MSIGHKECRGKAGLPARSREAGGAPGSAENCQFVTKSLLFYQIMPRIPAPGLAGIGHRQPSRRMSGAVARVPALQGGAAPRMLGHPSPGPTSLL